MVFSKNVDVVVFQKIHGPSAQTLAKTLKASRIKTIFLVCDLVETGMCIATDATIVVTEHLKSLYPKQLHDKIHVVHDGIERPEFYKHGPHHRTGSPSDPIRAVVVTSASLSRLPDYLQVPDWLRITIVGKYPAGHDRYQRLKEMRWNIQSAKSFSSKMAIFKFYANRKILLEQWSSALAYELMLASDIAIIPIDSNESDPVDSLWRVKSENRLTMKMAIALPVVAYPIASYKPVIVQGRNGFLAKSRREWSECLAALRDPELRKSIGDAARISVIDVYSKQEQARKFIQVIRSVLGTISMPSASGNQN